MRLCVGMPSEVQPTADSEPDVQRVLEGGCLCGAVRYNVTGPALDCGSCHCRSCRKASSAPELPFAQFALANFEITRGWPAQYHSSGDVTPTFCRQCGSPLTYSHSRHPDRLDIFTCSLDDPDALPPAYHVRTDHMPRWATIREGVPAFKAERPKG